MASQEETRKKLIKIGRCFAAELVGTAILTFCATEKAVLNNTSIGGDAISEEDAVTTNALAAGFSLIFLIYSLANVSGGHVNPAVTWAFVLTGRLPPLMGVVYFIAQFLGGLIGAGLLAAFSGVENFRGLLALHPGISVQEGLGTETFLTFLFVFVIFNVGVYHAQTGLTTVGIERQVSLGFEAMAPFVVGLTLTTTYFVAGPITGAGLNPARAFGPVAITGNFKDHWIYWVGPMFGSTIACIVFWILRYDFNKKSKAVGR